MRTFEPFCPYIHPSWRGFIENKEVRRVFLAAWEKVAAAQSAEFTPAKKAILRFLSVDLTRARVIILGQDPYPQAGIATGRAFEAGGLSSWLTPIKQSSMRNILRAVYGAYSGDFPSTPPPLATVRREIAAGRFDILPPDRLFASWESQGVLLLNTAFTCEIGRAGSHTAYWRGFTDLLLYFISKTAPPDTKWFLWGTCAANLVKHILPDKKPVIAAKAAISAYISAHPMLAGRQTPDDFFKNPCFYETKSIINWRGL